MQVAFQRAIDRDAMGRGGQRHRDRQRQLATQPLMDGIERGVRPGGAGDRQERAALLARFQRHLGRSAPRGRALGDGIEGRPVLRRGGPPGGGEQRAVDCTGALPQHAVQPGHQRAAVLDETFLDGGLDAVTVAEGADRIGRRQPGQQAIERIGGHAQP